MSLGCARCGDCCERIAITLDTAGMTAVVSTSGGMSVAKPQQNGRRLAAWAGRYVRDAAFMRRWMEPTGEVVTDSWENADGTQTHLIRQLWRCLKFDPVERVCTAHDERPQMCSGYPWYGGEPRPGAINAHETRCSYLLDLPPEARPEGARPLIPLTVVSR